ncbi:hypothetical protein [Virgibacillus sediminis]|uniref:Uncharacterized protein n=1 Tax=Virgibacillus sediminis TaxID=202260 RepID=A0ABV7A4A2_9BACI
MEEQEKYKRMLIRVIEETYSHKIQSLEEVIRILVNEITEDIELEEELYSITD